MVAIVPPGCDYDNNLSQIIELCNQTLLIGSPPFLRLDKIIGAGLSRVLTLARTIADLAGNDQIKTPHIADGLQFRPKGIVQEELFYVNQKAFGNTPSVFWNFVEDLKPSGIFLIFACL